MYKSLSILYLRCPHTARLSACGCEGLWTFNSLFEMPVTNCLVYSFLCHVSKLSILYLRCCRKKPKPLPPGIYGLSILYLRCSARLAWGRLAHSTPFNSLFEMHLAVSQSSLSTNTISFNSLFEMRFRGKRFILKFCAAFNSLFEMRVIIKSPGQLISKWVFQFSI